LIEPFAWQNKPAKPAQPKTEGVRRNGKVSMAGTLVQYKRRMELYQDHAATIGQGAGKSAAAMRYCGAARTPASKPGHAGLALILALALIDGHAAGRIL
jgi:hypothetical protein